jgi:hypothetical protein
LHFSRGVALMAAWHEGTTGSTIGAFERLRAYLAAWYRGVFRPNAPR